MEGKNIRNDIGAAIKMRLRCVDNKQESQIGVGDCLQMLVFKMKGAEKWILKDKRD